MKQHRTAKEKMAQAPKVGVTIFQPMRPRANPRVMRPGKTHKDKHITKCWNNRFENALNRAEEQK